MSTAVHPGQRSLAPLALLTLMTLAGCGSSSTATHSVGGTISGLDKEGLVLTNGYDQITVPAGTTHFTMPAGIVSGANFDIFVARHPVAVQCTVTNGSGVMAAADVTTVSIDCGPGTVSTLHSFGGQPDGSAPYWADLTVGSDGNYYGTTIEGGAGNFGALVKITPAGEESVLYSFTGGSDAGYPLANLVEGANGSFYGTAYELGDNAGGVLYAVTPDGVLTVLHSFGASGDGLYPYGGVLLASDGYYYGTTEEGGANGRGTVFRIAPDGSQYALLHSFGSGIDGQYPYGSLIQANDGNLYGTTNQGGAHGMGAVFKLSLDGTESVLYSFAGGADGSNPDSNNLVQGNDGSLYGMTTVGGASNLGTVFKVTLAGDETVLHSFGAASDGFEPTGSLILASDGNFYGMTYGGGDAGSGTVFVMAPDGTEAVLHSFTNNEEPLGGLTETASHDLIGMTDAGGDSGNGTAFVLN